MTYRNKTTVVTSRMGSRTWKSMKSYDFCQSGNSPRENGRLVFRPNTLVRTLQHARADFAPYTYKLKNSTVMGPNTGSILDIIGYVGSPNDRNRNDIIQCAVSKFYSELTSISFNVAQAFAERQQTINLIAKTATRLSHLYRSFRRGRNPFNGQRVNSKDASSLWLEYSYGWVPLISDVYTVVEERSLKVPEFHYRKTYSESSRVPFTKVRELRMYDAFTLLYEREYIRKRSCTIAADVVVNDPGTYAAAQIGLQNPALLAWELLPYSFVVDWFYPLGNWLENQSALKGLTLTRRQTTFTDKITGEYRMSVTSIDKKVCEFAYGHGHGSFIERYKDRALSIPTQSLPRLKSPLSTSHALSALSLLRQVFS